MAQNDSRDDYFKELWRSFAATYGNLRLLSEQLPCLADRLDEQTIEEMVAVTADTFGDSPEQARAELREFLPHLDNDHIYPDLYNQPDVREIFNTFKDTAFRRRVLKWAREEPLKSNNFFAIWADIMAQPPLSGIVLRKSVLINLTSQLEIFVDGILQGYRLYDSSEKKIPERLAWDKRWKCLEEHDRHPGWLPYKDTLREMIARRNALIHQDGKITVEGYLKQTQSIESLRPNGAAEGLFLLVPESYLQETFDISILFALALSQAAWRKCHEPHHSKSADEVLDQFIYQTLRQKRYPLVEKLADIALEFKPKTKCRRVIQVNRAIACREQGKYDEMKAILAELQTQRQRGWSVIPIAIAVLHGKNEEYEKLLKEAAQKGKLRKISPYWPLFDPIRNNARFNNLFKSSHGELPRPKHKQRM